MYTHYTRSLARAYLNDYGSREPPDKREQSSFFLVVVCVCVVRTLSFSMVNTTPLYIYIYIYARTVAIGGKHR